MVRASPATAAIAASNRQFPIMRIPFLFPGSENRHRRFCQGSNVSRSIRLWVQFVSRDTLAWRTLRNKIWMPVRLDGLMARYWWGRG